jgi:hypothetical protein
MLNEFVDLLTGMIVNYRQEQRLEQARAATAPADAGRVVRRRPGGCRRRRYRWYRRGGRKSSSPMRTAGRLLSYRSHLVRFRRSTRDRGNTIDQPALSTRPG